MMYLLKIDNVNSFILNLNIDPIDIQILVIDKNGDPSNFQFGSLNLFKSGQIRLSEH